MPIINLLPQSLRDKISAGEVIERPASVVKELIENSIDAGASNIDIEINNAGKRLIRVSDNGSGMDKEDAILCIQRYATSKLKQESDLFNIKSLGFRGEALSSISAVSKMTIITTERGKEGIIVEIHGGEIKGIKPVSTIGTTIEVRDIFYNTPARLKFLKTDYTELHHIIETVTNISMSVPNISFNFNIDGSNFRSFSKASDIKERLVQIFTKDITDRLLETVQYTTDISLRLFLGDAELVRNNRQSQHIFINRRWIRDMGLSRAIYNSLEDIIEKGKHPVFFMFIDMDTTMVDFNVHPTKREVRFKDGAKLFKMVSNAVNNLLKSKKNKEHPELPNIDSQNISLQNSLSVKEQINLYYASADKQTDLERYQELRYLYLFDTILAKVDEDGLMLIDYHAVHERINYERLLNKETRSAQLLFPCSVSLDFASYKIILQEKSLLFSLGFDVDDFGNSTVLIRAVPDILSNCDITMIIRDIAYSLLHGSFKSNINSNEDPMQSKMKAISSTIACHESIRGKDNCPDSLMLTNLLKSLEKTENPDYCPHGRPTKIVITKREILKMFKKT